MNACILIVEDEVDVLRANEQFLKDLGYRVYCAETLKAAWECIWEYPPDLILLDVMLPDGSGFDFCKNLRKYSVAPVIFLTAMGEDASIIDGLSQGGSDYIVKPYSQAVMAARVAAQLHGKAANSPRLELPPLYIDLVAGTVIQNGEKIKMAPKELQLLAYLVKNRGRILTQEQIYADVWDAPPETMGNIVRMNLSRLRQKLRFGSEDSCFDLSSSHRGYRFIRVRYPSLEP